MVGIEMLAGTIREDMLGRLPGQNKKQREGLSLLVATMLDVRSANLMDLAASLPRAAERLDMRYQWISRLLGNDLIEVDAVMAPYGRDVLARIGASGQQIVLIMDQTQLTARHQADSTLDASGQASTTNPLCPSRRRDLEQSRQRDGGGASEEAMPKCLFRI